MAHRLALLIDVMRTGSWLTRERATRWALALLAASVLSAVAVIGFSDGMVDFKGRPLGTDFSNIYVAGRHALDGAPAASFDEAAQHARAKAIFGESTPAYGWHYPPVFLLVAAPLALMPYPAALTAWLAATFALYLWSIIAIVRTAGVSEAGSSPPLRLALLLAAAFPAVLLNLGHGQNGFLTAALMGGGLALLQRRPWLSGILFGLMAYKPQFGLLLPLALATGGYWRTIVAAAVTVTALAALTTLCFGLDVWRAFLASLDYTRVVALEQGGTGWEKIQSVFSWVRMWGGSVPLAYTAQGMVSVAVAVAVTALWRSQVPFAFKAAALPLATLLATPYSLDYDMMLLAPTVAFVASHRLQANESPWQRTVLAALWAVPLIARSVAGALLLPLGALTMLAAFAALFAMSGFRIAPSTRWKFSSLTQR